MEAYIMTLPSLPHTPTKENEMKSDHDGRMTEEQRLKRDQHRLDVRKHELELEKFRLARMEALHKMSVERRKLESEVEESRRKSDREDFAVREEAMHDARQYRFQVMDSAMFCAAVSGGFSKMPHGAFMDNMRDSWSTFKNELALLVPDEVEEPEVEALARD
jgi:hypothetical protein